MSGGSPEQLSTGELNAPQISVAMSTYNRGALIREAIHSVLAQQAPGPPFELIVIDNNSTDDTRATVERFAAADHRVRYLFEPRQGLSFARNAGIAAARAPLIAFTDDDVRADPQWLAAIVRTFDQRPEAEMAGGRVLPLWRSAPPSWLTRDHWSPLALADHGDSVFAITPARAVCLVGANLAFRKRVFDELGGFATEYQRVKDGIGSLEDHEFLLRFLDAGRVGVYNPEIVVHAEVQADRLERRYHRRWHTGHGHFHALLKSGDMERTSVGRLFGVPAHLYRQAFENLLGWVKAASLGNHSEAFRHELRLRFVAGFFSTRSSEFLAARRARWKELPLKFPPLGRGRRVTATRSAARVIRAARTLDARCHRLLRPDRRHVLLDARTAMEYGMMAPVHRRLLADSRIGTWLLSSERSARAREIFRDAPPEVPILSPRAAMLKRFDAYLASDFVWANLPRGTCRVQMFHGVAGKWSRIYDRPDRSMRQWDRLFFINRRRLRNYIESGAIAGDSPAIRLVGMPKSDCLVDGSLTRHAVLAAHGLDASRPTVLYAPTWTRFSSLNLLGEELVARLIDAGFTVLVKLHDNSLDRSSEMNSGGVDWPARLEPVLTRGHGHLIRASDASPWMAGADVLISDHSSIGFEYLLLDRPLIRIEVPELLQGADIGSEYVQLITTAATSVHSAVEAISAVHRALADPTHLSAERRALAAELFYDPGHATTRAIRELYAVLELDLPDPVISAVNVQEPHETAEEALLR